MTNYLQQAEDLVRHHPANEELMRLEFGCEVEADHDVKGDGSADAWTTIKGIVLGDGFYGKSVEVLTLNLISDDYKNVVIDVPKEYVTKILGKKPHLEHYLKVLQALSSGWTACRVDSYGRLDIGNGVEWESDVMRFNLTTGQPATEEDCIVFINLVKGI